MMNNDLLKILGKVLIAVGISVLSFFGINGLPNNINYKYVSYLAIPVLVFAIVIIAGCSSVKPVEIKQLEEKRQTLQPPKPRGYVIQELILYPIKSDNKNYACFPITDYSKYVNNFQSLKKYIKEQEDIIKYYENQTKSLE